MRRIAIRSLLCAAAFLLPFAGAVTLVASRATADNLLAQARAATVRYHDADNALADGFVDLGPNPQEGEGIEFVNFGIVDCSLDVAQPEALRYVESGRRLRLVAVEYSIPFACGDNPPEDFLPGIGEWEQEPNAPAWSKTVWLWSGGSIGENSH